jgi:hypothetical protein
MEAIAKTSGLSLKCSSHQAALFGAPARSSTTRVFRHKFRNATPDLLVREDVFGIDPGLRDAASWRSHKTPVFFALRTDDPHLLDRILNAIETFAISRVR